ncbi:MAG: ribonuclease E/G [Deltaproteobacteria bacterium]
MKGSVIALDHVNGREVAALLVNGRLHDLLVDQAPDVPRPGTIYLGTADRPLKGMGAMMLNLPDGKTAFLREAAGLKPGRKCLVQVTTYVEDGKAAPVTAKVLFKGRYAIVTPDAPGLNLSRQIKDEDTRERLTALAEAAMAGSKFGLILRSAAEHAEDDAISADIAQMLGDAKKTLESGETLQGPGPHALALRDWSADEVDDQPGAFERHDVADLLVPFTNARFELSGGAYAFIEPTRAFVTVDVNTGADMTPAAGLKANLALVRELSHQLLVRGHGGQIVIDFAPMSKKDRHILDGNIRAAFKIDPIETALVGWTALGHYELQRKRERLPVNFAELL